MFHLCSSQQQQAVTPPARLKSSSGGARGRCALQRQQLPWQLRQVVTWARR
jgi:hypothetical protein